MRLDCHFLRNILGRGSLASFVKGRDRVTLLKNQSVNVVFAFLFFFSHFIHLYSQAARLVPSRAAQPNFYSFSFFAPLLLDFILTCTSTTSVH